MFNLFFFSVSFFVVHVGRHESYSSYDSLDKYNYALETLKLSDSGNYFNRNNCMLQPKCRQPYVHNDQKLATPIINDELITPNLPPRPPLPKSTQSSTTIDQDLAKQQQLSDWYYIKTGPKSPLPTPRSEHRNGIYSSVTQTTTIRTSITTTTAAATTATAAAANISNNNNTIEGIYVKNGNLSRESTKNNLHIHTENMMKRGENGSLTRFNDDVQITKTSANNGKDATENVYHAINMPSSCDDMQKIYTPPLIHQYSGGEPLCKFNLRNNGEKVNGNTKWQQPQEIQQHPQHQHQQQQQRLHLMPPPSPSVTSKKLHPQQSHPYYYVEPSQKHLSSPRLDKHTKQSVEYHQKSHEPQCEPIQVASKLHCHNERLNLAAASASASASVASATPSSSSLTTMMSNSNSNVHKLSGLHSQKPDHCGNANSSSFEHVNVTSGFSSLSASSEMTIDDKRRFTGQNYADEQCHRVQNNVVGESRQCLQQTVSSSPSLPVAHQSKVSV